MVRELLLLRCDVQKLKGIRYADVTHEVKPIISGHRVVLTYNVINDDRSMHLPAAATLSDHDSRLHEMVDLEGRGPDEEEFSGWTGNEGAYMTLWYRRAVSDAQGLQRLGLAN